MARGHSPHRRARAQERADHIGRENAPQPRGVDRLDARLPLQHGGIVHERVEPPAAAIHVREQSLDVRVGSDVGLHGERRAAISLDRRHQLPRRIGVRLEVDGDEIAAGRRKPRGRRADATTATSNNQGLHTARHAARNRIPATKDTDGD
jgi:hypothetical protein